jgi:hypothetical protein
MVHVLSSERIVSSIVKDIVNLSTSSKEEEMYIADGWNGES